MKTTMIAALAAMIALAPLGAAWSDTESTQAPAGANEDSTLGATAVAFCQLVDPGLPVACDPNPGVIPALGGAFFDVTSWNAEAGAAASYGRLVDATVTQIDGQQLGGFAADGCSDMDDDDSSDFCNGGTTSTDSVSISFCVVRDEYDYILIHDDGTVTNEHDGEYDDFVVFVMANLPGGLSAGTFQVDATAGSFVNQADCDTANGITA